MAPNRRKGSKAAAAAAAAKRQWKVGDLVLAKVKGFQAWPAMVSEPEKWGYAPDWKKVLVCFFGTQQIAFCSPADVEAFTEEKKQRLLGKRHGKYSEFGRALSEIVETFEKLKKQDEGNNSNDTDDDTMVSENITSEVLKNPVSVDKSPITASQPCQRKIMSSGTQVDVSGTSGCDADDTNGNESKNKKDVVLKEGGSGKTGTERSIITTYSTRRRSQRTQASRSSLLRRHQSARQSRSSSRVDVPELQNVSEPHGKCVVRASPSSLRNRSAGRNKRKRKTPDSDDNEVDSPDVVSNCSTEGNDSGIVTADSDAISFNEGSTTEREIKGVQSVPVTDLVLPDTEFSQRIEFQTSVIINKKKRKPKRKRSIEEKVVFSENLDERIASDSDVKSETIPEKLHEKVASDSDVKSETILEKLDERVASGSDVKSETMLETLDERVASDSCAKNETILEKVDERVAALESDFKSETIHHSDNHRSPERCSKENGDKHLPLSKRARVRMSHPLSTSEVDILQDSGKVQEEAHILSDQVSQSSHREVDHSTDQEACHDNGVVGKSSPLLKHPENVLLCEMKTTAPPDSSLNVEAALPPLKRLHRALEAMLVNADEDEKISVDEPLKEMTCSGQNRRNGIESQTGKEDELFNKNPVDSPLESLSRIGMSNAVGRASSTDQTTKISGNSTEHNSPKDREHCSYSSRKEIRDTVECFKLLSPDIREQGDRVACSSGSPVMVMPSDDQCKSTTAPPAEHFTEIKLERFKGNCDVTFEDNATSVLEDSADDSCKTTKSSDLTFENCKDRGISNGGDNVVENGTIERESVPSSFVPPSEIMLSLSIGENQSLLGCRDADITHSNSVSDDHSGDKSVSDDHSLDKSVSAGQSCSSQTDGLDSVSHVAPHTLAGNTLPSDTITIQSNGSCSPGARLHSDVHKRASKGKNTEAHGNLASFEAIIGTLTRGKDSIKRATRLAIECAKYGFAAKVVELITCNLEKESSLHRRVDLFFLVDCIAKSSKDLDGDVASVYPSAILAVLPRLLSAAAPPGSSSRENRRQCLKVLRAWLDRRILPESIIRHHIRELDSLCGSSCSRTSSRAFRKERPIDDPVREMEGMLDEYGSNSSLQFSGFCMQRLTVNEDNGVDSDGESFEALTPEHNAGEPETKRSPDVAVEKHRHILEDVDGELEMEDVSPVEGVASACDIVDMNTFTTSNHQIENSVTSAVPASLPVVMPPAYPPLPTSPPPPPPHPPLPPTVRPDSITSNNNSKVYACSQVPNQLPIPPANCSSFIDRHVSQPHHESANRSGPAPADVKGFRLPPPHPAPSNHFSYVQNEPRQSHRDTTPHFNSNRYHMPHTENVNGYRDCERPTYPPPYGVQEHWRPPHPYSGPNYPDSSGNPYAPSSYAPQHCEPHQMDFHSRGMNHQEFMHHGPPPGAPIPVSARGANYWRPR